MPRNVEDLARGRYDLLVVGGGIHGLFAAYDAAQRGLSVALVERADFGSGLSFNHQRTIHGGLARARKRPPAEEPPADRRTPHLGAHRAASAAAAAVPHRHLPLDEPLALADQGRLLRSTT